DEAWMDSKRGPNEPFTAATPGLIPGFTRAEVIVGGTIGVILHELGHALFDIQDIPLLGREEDAADQINALIMMQFGPKIAQIAIKGEFNVSHHSHAQLMQKQKGQIRPWQEADSHSVDIQRAWNVLCIAYGKDPQTFSDTAERLLPSDGCRATAGNTARTSTSRSRTPSARPSCPTSIRKRWSRCSRWKSSSPRISASERASGGGGSGPSRHCFFGRCATLPGPGAQRT